MFFLIMNTVNYCDYLYIDIFGTIKILVVPQINHKLCMYNLEFLNYSKSATYQTNKLTLIFHTGIGPLQSHHSNHLR